MDEAKPAAKPMRARMPQVAAFLDDLREAFGCDVIDAQIRRGMRGEPTFHASEGGSAIGTAMRSGTATIWYDPAVGATECEP